MTLSLEKMMLKEIGRQPTKKEVEAMRFVLTNMMAVFELTFLLQHPDLVRAAMEGKDPSKIKKSWENHEENSK